MTASLKKLSAGDGVTYYTRQTAIADATDRGRKTLSDYYSEKGERPGIWLGRGVKDVQLSAGDRVSEAQMLSLYGLGHHPDYDAIMTRMLAEGASEKERERATRLGQAYPIHDESSREMVIHLAERFRAWNRDHGRPVSAPVPPDIRAELRSEVGRESFLTKYHREPDERELHGHIARETRPTSKACAGYDVTFTPVKSVSVLWAVAPDSVVEAIEQAHFAAVQRSLAWLEDHALYTRRGAGGVRQVDVTGAVASAFQHRDSRDGDPNLHTHVVIANKVKAVEDGAWLAVDGQAIYKSLVCVSERYNTELELELNQRLGLRFAERERTDGKRPTREVVGIEDRVIDAMSRRRQSIDQRRAELAASFQARHGRPPNPIEAIQLAEQANLETRQDKHEPRSFNEQRAEWRVRIGQTVGGPAGIEAMVSRVREATSPRDHIIPDGLADELTERAVDTVEASRARFQINHVRAEADRLARSQNFDSDQTRQLADTITAGVVARSIQISRPAALDVPDVLRRRDGRSMYERAGSDLYTTANILEAEESIIAAGRRSDGRRARNGHVSNALVASAAVGVKLNTAQEAMVRELATSGLRAQLALAPAGSGKTTAMRVLSQAWGASGGTVLGLAPSAVAAQQLQAALGRDHVDTIAKMNWDLEIGNQPDWLVAVDERTLILVDEAGMAATRDLAQVIRYAIERGASVRLIGDDQQLAAVEAGGVLRDLKEEVGSVTLTELMRFSSPAEAAATLALREGDTEAIGFYLDHGRVHLHDEATILEAVYTAWSADRDAGLSSLMLAYSNETAAALNSRARADRVAAGGVQGPSIPLRGGVSAAAGDVIITRRNKRSLRLTATDYVKNGDLWDLTAVHEDGSISARHHHSGRTRILPADYVASHVDLGYAKTVHTAQGTTVDTCHTALNGEETRQLAYTAATRGRQANHLYLFASGDGDPTAAIDPDTIRPITAAEILARIIERDGSQISARTAIRQAHDPGVRLGDAHDIYRDAIGFAAITLLPENVRAEITAAAEEIDPRLTTAPAWEGALFGRLALHALHGDDPVELLRDAAAVRELSTASDPAAVLDWRIGGADGFAGPRPLPWLPALPVALADHPEWGHYLARLGEDVTGPTQELHQRYTAIPAESVPPWAVGLTGNRPLLVDVALWRYAHHVSDDITEPLEDAPPLDNAQAQHWKHLQARVTAALGRRQTIESAWAAPILEASPDISHDLYWPIVARRINQAAKGGMDVPTLLAAALARGPLPDEHPASALWYRLATTLAPAVGGDSHNRLRPPWVDTLTASLGDELTGRILRDPQWPALVAGVTTAERHGLTPADVVAQAVQSLNPATIGSEGGITHEELTAVLGWRVAALVSEPADHLVPEDAIHEPTDPEIEALLDQLAHEQLVQLDQLVGTRSQEPQASFAPPSDSVEMPQDRPTSVERIVALNEAASRFWADQYPHSPAANYVADRLAGNALAEDPRFRIGYAPASWTALVDHLRAAGASDSEIVDAGLGRYSRRGTLIDAFRDRVVIGITNPEGELVGFSGRALPTSNDTRKYINTAETAAFHKGAVLFGLHEGRDQLAAGAVPTLVEGPFDAIAITLATNGRAVGVAASGTALTQAQAELLVTHAPNRLGIGGSRTDQLVVVATDDDPAGRKAAERAFWLLQQAGADTRTLPLVAPDGGKEDPAASYARDSGRQLDTYLQHPDILQSLAWTLLDDATTQIKEADHVVARVHGLRRCATILASTPPERWDDDITAIIERIGGDQWDTETLAEHTIREAINWHSPEEGTAAPISETEQARARLQALSRKLEDRDYGQPSPTRVVSDELAQRLKQAQGRAERLQGSPSVSPEPPALPERHPGPARDERPDRGVER